MGDLAVELVGARQVDAQQAMPVRAGAGATAPGLDAKPIVEQSHEKYDAGDVAGRRERADTQRPGGVTHQFSLEHGDVDVAVGVLRDHHDIGDRLAPRQLVGMMLEGSEEHDRTLVGGDGLAEVVSVVQR